MTEVKRKPGRPRIDNPSTPQERNRRYMENMRAKGGIVMTFRIQDAEKVRKLEKYAAQKNLSRSAAAKLLFERVIDLVE